MRYFSILTIAALLFVAIAALPALAQSKSKDKAMVTHAEGKTYKSKSQKGPWAPLNKGDLLDVKEVLKTDAGSRAEIMLPDKSILRIGPNSMFQLTASLFPKDEPRKFSATLLLGSIWARVSRAMGDKDKFEVKTKTAVAGVRGTVWSVNAEDSGASLFKVYDGSVAVTPPGKKPKEEKEAKKDKKGKGGREEMDFPQEISKKEWFELLLGRMQAVKIGADGKAGKTYTFDADKEGDKWAAWNLERDKELDKAEEEARQKKKEEKKQKKIEKDAESILKQKQKGK